MERLQQLAAPRAHARPNTEARDMANVLDKVATEYPSLPELAAVLREIRDQCQPPASFAALLRQHARYGTDPARYAVLAAATARDTDLDAWLSAAAESERPADPGRTTRRTDVPGKPGRLGTCSARRADGPAAARQMVAPWRALASTPVQRAAGHLGDVLRERLGPEAREEADRQFLLGCREIFAADTAMRAGIGLHLTVRDVSPDGQPSPAAWALLGRRPLDHNTVALIAGWPVALRRVLGFARLQRAGPSRTSRPSNAHLPRACCYGLSSHREPHRRPCQILWPARTATHRQPGTILKETQAMLADWYLCSALRLTILQTSEYLEHRRDTPLTH